MSTNLNIYNLQCGVYIELLRSNVSPSRKSLFRKVKTGFTLIELLIVMLLVVIISIAALTMFRNTVSYESNQQDILEHTQNLRNALYVVGRDVRMAGNGLNLLGVSRVQIYVPDSLFDPATQRDKGWFQYTDSTDYGAIGIYGTESGVASSGSDTLTIFRTDIENCLPIARLERAYYPGENSTSLDLSETVAAGTILSDGDIIAVVNGPTCIILEARVSEPLGSAVKAIKLGERFFPMKNMPNGGFFPAGSSIYNLQNVTFVTYYVDSSTQTLKANYHDFVGATKSFSSDGSDVINEGILSIADNIEDLQVGYFIGASDTFTPVFQPGPPIITGLNRLIAVQLAIISRSSNMTKIGTGEPITTMGHTASDQTGFSRRVMSEVISLRNL